MAVHDDKPTRVLMHEMVKEMPIVPGQVFTKDDALNWFASHYAKIKEGTITAHLIRVFHECAKSCPLPSEVG